MITMHRTNDSAETADDLRFDAAMRAHHRASLDRVSPQVRWKLQPLAPPARANTRRGWGFATAFAGVAVAVFAVAIGFDLRSTGPASLAVPATTASTIANASDDGATVYEQDPEFFAWLASDDADLVAME